MNRKIKICGVRTQKILEFLVEKRVEYVGFNFFKKSPRYISVVECKTLFSSAAAKKIKKVVIVVDPEEDFLEEIFSSLKPDYLQLHGEETAEYVRQIKEKYSIPIIKAISVENSADLEEIKKYEDVVDMFLFDAKHEDLPGGNGVSFDWNILKNLQTKKPWFLSGGLKVENVKRAINLTGAKFVDIASGVEETRGIKSKKLIEELVNELAE